MSAWGESAGASSILHHLVQDEGSTDPLFQRAVIQSPAYEIMWDRNGTLNQTYENFVDSAVSGYPSRDIECVRKLGLDDQALIDANVNLVNTYYNTAVFPVGPAVDGTLINRLPVNEFASSEWH